MHVVVLGDKYVSHRNLRLILDSDLSPLVKRDVVDVDKQDDGAARRVFHSSTISAAASMKSLPKYANKDMDGFIVYAASLGTYMTS